MNEIRTTAWDLQAGDVMWDQNGPLRIVGVRRWSYGSAEAEAAGADPVTFVRVDVRGEGADGPGRGTFGATWEFDADDIVRLESRAVSA